MQITVTGGIASGKTTFLRNLQKDFPAQIITVGSTSPAALGKMIGKDEVVLVDEATTEEAARIFRVADAGGRKGKLLAVAVAGYSSNDPLKVVVSGEGADTFDVSKYIP